MVRRAGVSVPSFYACDRDWSSAMLSVGWAVSLLPIEIISSVRAKAAAPWNRMARWNEGARAAGCELEICGSVTMLGRRAGGDDAELAVR